ncbi:MAG: hypothetical protein ACRC7S_13970 [Cetobacterium sp.]
MFGKNKEIKELKERISYLQEERELEWRAGLDNLSGLLKAIEEQLGLDIECNIEFNNRKITFYNLKIKNN